MGATDLGNNEKRKLISRIGIGAKGIVYLLVGGLTAWAAFGSGGKKTGSEGVFKFLENQAFGQLMLGVLIVGLACYIFWRLFQTFSDPEDKGADKEGLGRRIGYFSSGVFYLLVIYSAIEMLLNLGGGNGGSGGKESLIQKLLNQDYGQWLVVGVALIFLGKALWQLYRAYSGKFKDKIEETGLDYNSRRLVYTSGLVGYTARGLVVGVIAFLTVKAALSYQASKSGGTKDAFQFVQDEFGSIVLGVIALGLVCYGIFIMIKARYREMNF